MRFELISRNYIITERSGHRAGSEPNRFAEENVVMAALKFKDTSAILRAPTLTTVRFQARFTLHYPSRVPWAFSKRELLLGSQQFLPVEVCFTKLIIIRTLEQLLHIFFRTVLNTEHIKLYKSNSRIYVNNKLKKRKDHCWITELLHIERDKNDFLSSLLLFFFWIHFTRLRMYSFLSKC